jgi:hypothetical protein
MPVVGVPKRSHTQDDLAVFVDVKTAWVVQGLVHGHEDLGRSKDTSVVIERSEGNVVANAKLVEYTEISDEHIDRFHFHGDPSRYPLSAIIVVPNDDKTGTILRGRYLIGDEEGEGLHQLMVPGTVIDGLPANIFRIKNVLDAVIFVVAIATVQALTLVFALSIRLRRREFQTVFRLGGSRLTIVRLLVAEMAITVCVCRAITLRRPAMRPLLAGYPQLTSVNDLLAWRCKQAETLLRHRPIAFFRVTCHQYELFLKCFNRLVINPPCRCGQGQGHAQKTSGEQHAQAPLHNAARVHIHRPAGRLRQRPPIYTGALLVGRHRHQ